MYKTVVIKYSPKAREMASKVEETANEMEKKGFELVSCSIMLIQRYPDFQKDHG